MFHDVLAFFFMSLFSDGCRKIVVYFFVFEDHFKHQHTRVNTSLDNHWSAPFPNGILTTMLDESQFAQFFNAHDNLIELDKS